jgi:two-component system, cell cycle sensor histidine kinase and response regulator CckA
VELTTSLQADLWLVRCDPGQLEQVVLNLAVNARDAMPDGGRLTIETSRQEVTDVHAVTHPGLVAGQYVRLVVRDSGVGMTPEVKERLFEPFFTTKEPSKGTGLGLATVYGIVTQSGGLIRVESEPGSGSAFEIVLPRCLEAPRAAPAPAGPSSSSGSETILLVEDELAVRDVAARSLRERGYRVLVAADGQEALTASAREPGFVQLLLTDVVLPGLGGRQLADELCRRRPGLRVLLMSGHVAGADALVGIGDGASFLQKPFTAPTLAAKVRQVLDANGARVADA